MIDAFIIDWIPSRIGLGPTGWIMMRRVAFAPPVPRIAFTHASRYMLRSVFVASSLPFTLCGSLKHSSIRLLLNDLKAVAICVHTALTSAAMVAADEAAAGNVIHWPSASWCVFTKTYMPSSTAHCAVCTTFAIHAESIVYAGPAPM